MPVAVYLPKWNYELTSKGHIIIRNTNSSVNITACLKDVHENISYNHNVQLR